MSWKFFVINNIKKISTRSIYLFNIFLLIFFIYAQVIFDGFFRIKKFFFVVSFIMYRILIFLFH